MGRAWLLKLSIAVLGVTRWKNALGSLMAYVSVGVNETGVGGVKEESGAATKGGRKPKFRA